MTRVQESRVQEFVRLAGLFPEPFVYSDPFFGHYRIGDMEVDLSLPETVERGIARLSAMIEAAQA